MEKQPGNGILEEFRIEFADCWQRVPNKGFFLVLLTAWLALFHTARFSVQPLKSSVKVRELT